MQSRIITLVLLILIIVVSLSSCKSEVLITGEVFIVIKAGQSIKLGLVDVMVFAEADAQQYLDKKNKESATKDEELKKEYETAKAKYEDVNKKYLASEREQKDADSRYEAASSRVMAAIMSGNDAEKKAAERDREVWQQRRLDLIGSGTSEITKSFAEQEKKNDEKKWLEWPTGDFFYQELPKDKVLTKVTTDADGKFTIKLKNSGKYLVVAKSQRDVIGSTETYYWFVWLSSDVESKHIMLTNNNLLGTEATEVAIKTKNAEKALEILK